MKLVIFIGEQHRIDDLEVPHPVEVHDNGGWRTGLPEYGADWSRHFKKDIVMLVEEDPDAGEVAGA